MYPKYLLDEKVFTDFLTPKWPLPAVDLYNNESQFKFDAIRGKRVLDILKDLYIVGAIRNLLTDAGLRAAQENEPTNHHADEVYNHFHSLIVI